MRDPLLGTMLAQYELQDQLGAGGMAIVYRGFQPSLGRAVAVKVLPPGLLTDPTLPARFRREARLAANLMHANIVPVYDFGEWEGYLYIVMALITGGTLKDRMEAPLPLHAVVRLVGQVADALGFAHNQGVYHRDVKPANVLLAASDWAMLSDFGIARALGETTRLTLPYGTLGTPVYMAPEQWLGHEIDGRADIYSLGVVLYELLAGRPPFAATTAQGLMRQHLESPVPPLTSRDTDVPAALHEVIGTALAKRPEDRFQHAGQFKVALEDAVQNDHGAHGPASPTRRVTGVLPRETPNSERTIPNIVPDEELRRRPRANPRRREPVPTLPILLGFMLVLVIALAVGMGYLLAGGRGSTQTVAPTQAGATAISRVPSGPTQAGFQVTSTTSTGATDTPPPTSAPKPTAQQPTGVSPTSPPKPAVEPKAAPPTSPPASTPAPTVRADSRFPQIERRVENYFQALNDGDYAKAHAICCTPSWRSRYPLDEWQRNFAGVADLRYSTAFRYTTVEPTRVVAEVDYSFVSRGDRRYFVLRWTFVPTGGEWLADDAQAFPQGR